jgi:bromodomain adjacent to zinc finger domain protein 1A
MPILYKKPFAAEPVPEGLKPDEEIFVCQPTKEVFRDYE